MTHSGHSCDLFDAEVDDNDSDDNDNDDNDNDDNDLFDAEVDPGPEDHVGAQGPGTHGRQELVVVVSGDQSPRTLKMFLRGRQPSSGELPGQLPDH